MDDIYPKLSFLENIFGKPHYSSSTKEAVFFCPFCRHYKRKLSVNILTDQWQCFVCGNSGRNLVYLLRRFGQPQDVKDYVNYHKSSTVVQQLSEEELNAFRLWLPKEFIPIVECQDSLVGRKAFRYLTRQRGVSELDILRYKIGTAVEGQYRNRVIFPSFDRHGNLNLFTSRTYNGEYWSPSTPKGYKNQIILNEINIDWSEPVIVVEGFIDMLKTDGNAVPLFGSYLGEESKLFRTIVKNSSTVFLALDADADLKSHKIAKKLLKRGISVYNIDVRPYEDVGQMSKVDFRVRRDAASPVSEEDVFRSKVRAL